jgi:hypothetical protein
MKKLIATVAVAGLLVVGGAGAAFAADGGSTGPNPATTQPAAGARRAGHPALRRGLRRAALRISADTIHVDVDELRADLRNGQSIAQVAQAKGVDPKTVVDALVTAADARIDALASSGRITAERAAKLKEKVPDVAQRVVNHVPKSSAAKS